MAISLEEVRRRILIALFSDDQLMDALVLKGGNALALVYKLDSRASVDMDFSIQDAFSDLAEAHARIFRTLEREFASIGYVVFDGKFEPRPLHSGPDRPEWWGGYIVEFKLAERKLYEDLKGNIEALRRQSEELGPLHRRIYTIDISHHEFCDGKVSRNMDDYTIYVYSLEMLAAEKLRAICQQMPQYDVLRTKRPRARDFYDIHGIVTKNGIDMTIEKNRLLLATIFSAKHVDLDLLGEIHNYRDYHSIDWAAVAASISGSHEDFDFYFNFVAELASRLHAFWIK